MKENMKVFKSTAGRNFKIEDADVVWTDFSRHGNPAKGVPAGGLPTFTVRFDSPDAGDNVAEALKEAYGVTMRIVMPKDDQDFKPYNSLKVAARFDKFPPLIIYHSGDVVETLSTPNPDQQTQLPQEEIDARYERVAILDHIVIERMDVEVNVSVKGKAYVRSMEIWQKIDELGRPMEYAVNSYEELTEE